MGKIEKGDLLVSFSPLFIGSIAVTRRKYADEVNAYSFSPLFIGSIAVTIPAEAI